MMCEVCGRRTARMSVTVLFAGKSLHRKLCPQCAGALQRGDAAGLQAAMLGMTAEEKFQTTPPCPQCGRTLEQLCRTGRAGCSACYLAFSDTMDALFLRMDGKKQHEQAVVSQESEEPAVENSALDALRRQLQEAVSVENYERAAELRDEIRALMGQSGEAQSE